MKRFTILFSVLLVLGFGGVLAYVAASPEFVPISLFLSLCLFGVVCFSYMSVFCVFAYV